MLGGRIVTVRPQVGQAVTGAAVTMSAVLAAWGATLALAPLVGAPAALAAQAAVLALVLVRSLALADARRRLVAVLATPAIALGAHLVGRLLVRDPAVGGALFTAGVSLPIWMRRLSRGWRRLARVLTLPFIGILVVPAPVVAATAGTGSDLVPAAVALVACACAVATVAGARGMGWLPPVLEEAPATTAHRASGRRRLPPSTRMAIQMAVAVGGAFVVGELAFGREHWAWVVLSAFLVCSRNRGRGDVVLKGAHRLAGATAGTVLATLGAGALGAGGPWSVVAIFAVMAVGVALRDRWYACWAAAVTAILALLAGYYGATSTTAVLDVRLLGVLTGVALGVAASWWVLPVRTVDVARRRIGDALRAFRDLVEAEEAGRHAHHAAFHARVAAAEEIAPALRAHRRLRRAHRPADGPHLADAVEALLRRAAAPLGDDGLHGDVELVLRALEHARRDPGKARRAGR